MAGPHHRGTYPARAKRIRALANADPTTRCRRCGLTLDEFRKRYPNRDATWQAGHTVDGDSRYPLAAEHAWCNTSAGAVTGNQSRRPRSGWA